MIDSEIEAILNKQNRTEDEALQLSQYFSHLDFFDKLSSDMQDSAEHLLQIKLQVLINSQIFKSIKYAIYPRDYTLFTEGDLSNGLMYVIINGVVKVTMVKNTNVFVQENLNNLISAEEKLFENHMTHKSGIVAKLTKGKAFGEKAILVNGGVCLNLPEKKCLLHN